MTQAEKNIELYKASLPAFFTNEFETDKTILGLSVGAIGFYMALFLNKDLTINTWMFSAITTSLVAFFIVSSMILLIFYRNRKQLLHIIETTGGIEEDAFLNLLDKWKYWPFVIGIISSIVFTVLLMFTKINHKESSMAQDNNQTVFTKDGASGVASANQSKPQVGISGLQDANKTPPPPPSNQGSKNGK